MSAIRVISFSECAYAAWKASVPALPRPARVFAVISKPSVVVSMALVKKRAPVALNGARMVFRLSPVKLPDRMIRSSMSMWN